MKKFFGVVFFSFGVYFFSWLLVYFLGVNTLSIQSEDTLPAMFLPVSVIKEGTLYADTYYEMLIKKYPHPDDKSYEKGLTPFYLRRVNGHYISAFPILTGLLALPVYLLPVVFGMTVNFDTLTVLAHISSALITALSGGFFYLLLKRHFLKDESKALLVTGVYLFGTINYALISQALWQHGSLQLFLILGLYFFLSALEEKFNNKNLFLSGLFFGLSILSRPTAGLPFALMFAFLLWQYKNSFVQVVQKSGVFLAGLVPAAVFFAWYNFVYYQSVSNQGYAGQLSSAWLSRFPEGFLGVWLSPSKGILIYSPVLILAFTGLFLVLKEKILSKDTIKYAVFAVIVFLHTLVIGKWKHWYGGWSFGYRMSSDIIPFLVLLLVPFVQSPSFEKYKKIFYSLFIISILVQVFGIIFFDGIWHAAYDKGFENTSWLWSINDSEFMFNVRRVLVKLGVLSKACAVCR